MEYLCVKCASPNSRFLCKCGTRYCGSECQKGHWPDHKADCKKALLKETLDEALQQLVETWDDGRYACFSHFSKKEGIECGYYSEVLSGALPFKKLTSCGILAYIQYDVIEPLIKLRAQSRNYVKCVTWSLALPNTPLKKITSVMLRTQRTSIDMILQIYNPEIAQSGWAAFHFFDYEKAVSITGPLMDVD